MRRLGGPQSNIDLASIATAHRHMRLLRLSLTDFRNYAALTWRPAARISVLFGPNGSGKTNLLEAVSLLVPGRGLRGARNADLPRHGGAGGWAVAGRFATADGEVDIGTGTPTPGPEPVHRPDPEIVVCSAWTAPRRAARRKSPPASPRSGSRRRWIGCSRRARPAAAASSIGWSGRWSPAMRARSPHTRPPWRSATACWRTAAPIRPGSPGWRMPWRATRSRPPRRAWPWSRG